LPAHVARSIGPSPARAEPHDASTWLPVPDPHGLPSIEMLLDGSRVADDDAELIDLTAIEATIEALVSPSPARAEPHDAAAWLPLPDVDDLPSVHALLDPHPDHQAAVVAEAEAVVSEALAVAEASSAPSPARAEPHDAATWLPLPSPEELRPVTHLLEEGPPAGTPPRPRRRTRFLPAPRVLGVAVMVVLTTLGGAWIAQQATAPSGSDVMLVVDGARQRVHTDADSVGALLTAAHVQLNSGDVVVPAAVSALHDGIHVDVLRSFPVTVDVDGSVRTVRTVETSADKLAKQLKLAKLVAVRNKPGRLAAGASVVYRTRVGGSLTIDNQKVTFDSPSRTVDELLQSYNVKLVGDDYAIPAPDTLLHDGDQVAVVRVGAETSQTTRDIDFDTVEQEDPTLPIGQTRILQDGKKGTMTVTYRQLVENGQKGDKQVVSEVPTVEPTPKIIGIGSYANPRWDELAMCESGGRWDTVDSGPDGYDGGLGIYRGTWRSFGGTEFAPNAGLATREQQIIVGMRIYEKLGWDPWGCANNVLHWPQWSG
jgi:resuscitation-promoting factor RpfB